MSNTAITVTVQDPTGQPWSNGLITYQLYARRPVFFNGVELTDADFLPTTLSLDSSGSASFSVKDNAQMTPSGCIYRITVNPNATSQGITVYSFLTGVSLDISSQVNDAIAHPIVNPIPIPFAYADENIQLLYGVAELYYNTGPLKGFRYYDGTTWQPLIGGGVTKIIAGTNITISPPSGIGDVTINAVGLAGITQLDQDVLAGPGSGLQHATCVMVHAFDLDAGNPNSQFYIDTEIPALPGATTAGVGLFARNTRAAGAHGQLQIVYDNDDLSQWVLKFGAQFGTTGNPSNNNGYIYQTSGMFIISDLSGDLGQPQWFFGNKYDGTGQLLGIYYDGVQGFQIETQFGPNPSFLILGGANDNLQLNGVSLTAFSSLFAIGGIISHIAPVPSAAVMAGGAFGLIAQISGAATINTITPQVAPPGSFTGLPVSQFCFVQATGAWSVTNTGNITTPPFTAIVGHNYLFVCVDGTTWQIYDLTSNSVHPGTFNTGITLGVAQQNLRNAPIIVTTTCTTSGTSTGSLTAKIGPTSPPTNTILINENTASVASANVAVTFGVPTGWFYEVDGAGDITGVTSSYETVMV